LCSPKELKDSFVSLNLQFLRKEQMAEQLGAGLDIEGELALKHIDRKKHIKIHI